MQANKLSFKFILVFFLVVWTSANSDPNSALAKKESAPSLEDDNPTLPLFSETSITRNYLNQLNGLAWENPLGDWEDINGTPQGKKPWASVKVPLNFPGPILLDVTTLALAQRGKSNQLMVLAATGPIDIWSREGKHSPRLRVTLSDGSVEDLLPAMDCYIALSSIKNINNEILHFDSGSSKALIQFSIPRKEFESAVLELWPSNIYRDLEIQVFNLAPQQKMFKQGKGIAHGLPSYAALQGHPDVIFLDTFDEGSKLKPDWSMQGEFDPRPEKVTNGFLAGKLDPETKTSFRSALNIRYFFAKNGKEEPTETYFRYSVRFHRDLIYATQSGKLPGQAGTYNQCGWGGRTPSPSCEGWQARMSWEMPIKSGPYRGLIPIGSDFSEFDEKKRYDKKLWQAFCEMDKWCELEQYVKLNTPGKANGIVRGYHEGKLVYERDDIQFRGSDAIRTQDIWALVYHGGMGYPKKTIHVDLDNIVVSRSYIGEIGKSESATRNESERRTSLKKQVVIPGHLGSRLVGRNSSTSAQPAIEVSPRAVKNRTKEWAQNPQFANLDNNSAIDLGKFSCTVPEGDKNSCEKVTDFSGMVYDQNHHQILMFGGGHSTTFTDTVFIFDFDSLFWKEDYPPTPCTTQFMNEANFDRARSAWKHGPAGPYPRPVSRHTYDRLVVATDVPELIVIGGGGAGSTFCPPYAQSSYSYSSSGKVAHYNVNTKMWTFSESTSGKITSGPASPEYDPISGHIVIFGNSGLRLYDPVGKTNMTIKKYIGSFSNINDLVYYPPNDRFYFFDGRAKSVWELRLDRKDLMRSTFEKLITTGIYPPHKEPGYAYDKVNGVIGGAVFDNRFFVFDPRTKSWSHQFISGGKPGNLAFHCIVYDPVNNAFIFLTDSRKTWAYRYRS